jgi:hypothetical protein
MTAIPLPAFLAMIVLLLWPAARFAVVLMEPARAAGAPSAELSRSEGLSWRRALIGITTVAGQLLLLMASLCGVYLTELIVGHFWGDELSLFGGVSLKSLFRFVDLVQFSVFTIYAAIETRRALRADIRDQTRAGAESIASFGPLLAKVSGRLKADLPIYLSAPALSVVLLLVGITLLGRAVVVPG